MNVVGNSDPGATGVLTPFIKTDGLNISDKNEPENGQFKLLQIIEEATKNENYYVETFGIETEEQYAELLENIYNNTRGCDLAIKKEYLVEEDNNE